MQQLPCANNFSRHVYCKGTHLNIVATSLSSNAADARDQRQSLRPSSCRHLSHVRLVISIIQSETIMATNMEAPSLK